MIKSLLKKGTGIACWLVIATFICTVSAQARVCFLPGGMCPGGGSLDGKRAIQSEQCLGYNLTQVKCKDQACEIGWDCESCTNAQGTFYKCTPKPTPSGGLYVNQAESVSVVHNRGIHLRSQYFGSNRKRSYL